MTLTVTASACAKSAQWSRALRLLEDAQTDGVAIDAGAHNAVLYGCEQGHRWTWSVQLLDRMRSAGLQTNAITHCALAGACEKAGQVVFAHRALVAMRRSVQRRVMAGPSEESALLEEPVCAMSSLLSYDDVVHAFEAHLIRRRMNCSVAQRPTFSTIDSMAHALHAIFGRHCSSVLSAGDGIGASRTR
eukprot:CAMPEP_0171138558 /NCGR_PEP_ID=MMETSP0766_2-20121228/135276_1 /TAXON_ID=439317 /ORGANISM="Gambierdiscus australes, Strain CAWD 149" /LENGTH=188 /DNA_ID=CAMNT_0011602173 /DNA_START=14 /DNA_END=577 /DNA_ORIENTATION=-